MYQFRKICGEEASLFGTFLFPINIKKFAHLTIWDCFSKTEVNVSTGNDIEMEVKYYIHQNHNHQTFYNASFLLIAKSNRQGQNESTSLLFFVDRSDRVKRISSDKI